MDYIKYIRNISGTTNQNFSNQESKEIVRAIKNNRVYKKLNSKKYRSVSNYTDYKDLCFVLTLNNMNSNPQNRDEDVLARGIANFCLSREHPIYWVSKELFTALINTKVPKVFNEIKKTLDSFVLMLPNNAMYGHTGDHCGCLLVNHFLKNESIKIKPFLFDEFVEDEFKGKSEYIFHSSETGNLMVVGVPILAPRPWYSSNIIFEREMPENTDYRLENFVYNLILYLQNYEEKITTDSSSTGFRVNKQKLKAKDVGQGYSPIRWLGKGYKIKYESGSPGTHKSPETHIRMGHWRKQPIGPRDKDDHKMIWIEPMLVNAN
ncbi:hypothetical protein Lepto7375DRAFT_7311 [Leptolyngbya sp. PCC 7375]|nr:hypothetical protein Lepto7375DRAFT_7311 [Leptolyngbya sp. PCC 7375]